MVRGLLYLQYKDFNKQIIYYYMDKKELEKIRHSCAHIIAAAAQKLFKGAKFGVGPVIDHGFYYDKTPVQDGYMTAETPDNNRIGLTAGLGYNLGNVQIDLSFLYIHSAERQQTQAQAEAAGTYDPSAGSRDVLLGTYRLNALIPGISIAYKF